VEAGMTVGLGTGSTVAYLLPALSERKLDLRCVATSPRTEAAARDLGIPVEAFERLERLDIAIDGADQVAPDGWLVKGGGGALTREKIVAAVARKFVCIADDSKLVATLGKFPLPVEVIPMACAYVARELARLGGEPHLREGFTTDNGNVILDVSGLTIRDPIELEDQINDIAGVVTNGLFARRPADVLLLGTQSGIRTLNR
jgi:ribose 5-phosphate isomerase A